jgi:hypothetical protein
MQTRNIRGDSEKINFFPLCRTISPFRRDAIALEDFLRYVHKFLYAIQKAFTLENNKSLMSRKINSRTFISNL